jgi:hypothetical protein
MKTLLFLGLLLAQMMAPPPAMTDAAIARAQPGDKINLVVRVDGFARHTIAGHVLNPLTSSSYRLTKNTMAIYAPQETAYVMGSADDVHPGAVLYIYAVATKANAADATRIVVITPYATVRE